MSHQDIKLGRILDQLHACIVHNGLAVLNLRVLLMHLPSRHTILLTCWSSAPQHDLGILTNLYQVVWQAHSLVTLRPSCQLCAWSWHSQILRPAAYLSAAFDEQPICHLHNVGLVDGVHTLPAVIACIFEGVLRHTCACISSDHLHRRQTLRMQTARPCDRCSCSYNCRSFYEGI